MSDAYFEPTPDGLAPSPDANGPWSPNMLHGRLLAGLAARAIEAETPDGFRLARLTVDLFKAAPMEPVTVTARVARSGGRVRAVDVVLECAGAEVARATSLLLRTSNDPGVDAWTPPEWDVLRPEDIAPPEEGEGPRTPGWDIRPISPGGFRGAGQKRVWVRDQRPLVAGEALTPTVRVALSTDLTNPLANSGLVGFHFINADLSVSIRRLPVGEWVGLEVSGHLDQDGIAVGACTVYDEDGAIGYSTVSAVATAPLTP